MTEQMTAQTVYTAGEKLAGFFSQTRCERPMMYFERALSAY